MFPVVADIPMTETASIQMYWVATHHELSGKFVSSTRTHLLHLFECQSIRTYMDNQQRRLIHSA